MSAWRMESAHFGNRTATNIQSRFDPYGRNGCGITSHDVVAVDGARGDDTIAVPIAPSRRRGRGATINPTGRFEPGPREAIDDGWDSLHDLPPLRTTVIEETPRTIITKNNSPDISFDRSINPYRGCEHGCVYCFARPTHAFLGHSPGLDFETQLYAKPTAPELLAREISRRNYVPRPIAFGTNTDPYQPMEKHYRIMRQLIEVLARANHPLSIVTKSAMITRDLDLLAPMAEKGLISVALSVTSLDHKLARAMEPRAATPARRLFAMQALSEAGVPVAAMVAPVIPALNDAEIERIVESIAAYGATSAGFILLRLPLEVRDIFAQWLLDTYPDKAKRVFSLLRQMRQGKDYDGTWGQRMRGTGPYAWLIGRRFRKACEMHKLNITRRELRTDLFVPPQRNNVQGDLFAAA